MKKTVFISGNWRKWGAYFFLFLVCVTPLLLCGCASTEPENYSSRPWDSPRSWETGLPSALTEGR
ncbi:MAG TPA: hypothetical protein VLT36_19355 [Candidatus Dormibacteraeota bacterium]|nr:hypothetical protein [Candidatus Dormibacteraeota bacterium]